VREQAERDRMGRQEGGAEKHAAIEECGIFLERTADDRRLIALLSEN